jgi:hypothetical protein
MKAPIENPNKIRESFEIFSNRSSSSHEYCQSALVATINTLMSVGWEFQEALDYCKGKFPSDCRHHSLFFPKSYLQ